MATATKLKPIFCYACQRESKEKNLYRYRWGENPPNAYELPTRTIIAFGSTMHFNKGCNRCRARLLKAMRRAYRSKPSPTRLWFSEPLPFIETVRVGSHKEWVETDDKGHGFHRIVDEFTTIYHDCLAGKDWLKEHEHDLDRFEPTIEVRANGKTLSLNGNFKKGIIKEFIK